MLKQLYKSRYLSTTSENHKKVAEQFWSAFQDALDVNIRGIDKKRRILSIIADKIPYEIIKKKLLVRFDISQGSDIELAIEGIRGTSVAYLEPERTKVSDKKWINTLLDNSNWFSWEWLCDGDYAGYIRAHAIPNIGEWNNFSLAKLEKLKKKEIQKPHPQTYKIYNILLNESVYEEFPLTLGWALKENQKFRKKGAGKRISKHVIAYLEEYFLVGNADKSDRYSTEEM
ncbi:7529_t:CDS:2 [Cetraspora pellucida]|uniref:7529_t:CDS:1 n=1 Tax=Cetraspora pellucida TaxID=1433469 RepID=A0A9N8VUB7_9GLOM|nr:7529_t:CDS:2 [Cetraspora pellucida]